MTKFSQKMPLSNYQPWPMMNQKISSIFRFCIPRMYDFCQNWRWLLQLLLKRSLSRCDIIFRRKSAGVNLPGFELQCNIEAIFYYFWQNFDDFGKKRPKIALTMQCSSKLCGMTPIDFLLKITDIKTDQKKSFLFKQGF